MRAKRQFEVLTTANCRFTLFYLQYYIGERIVLGVPTWGHCGINLNIEQANPYVAL